MKYLITAILHFAISGLLFAQSKYVSPDGNDNNIGTREQPYASIQAGINAMTESDTLFILPGSYHESVVVNIGGSASGSLVISATPGTVTIDAAKAVSTVWTLHEGGIYKTSVAGTVEQVFFKDQMLVEARWPNMRFPDEQWDRATWSEAAEGSTKGIMIDPALTETNIDWTGAQAVLNVSHQWWTWTSVVTEHTAGSDRFKYRTDDMSGMYDETDYYKYNDDYYYLRGKLEALDMEGEWFYDKGAQLLYVYLPGGSMPEEGEIRIKQFDFGISVQDADYVQVSGIDFFACTFELLNTDYCIVEDCEALFPAYSRTIKERYINGSRSPSSYVEGNHNSIRNCKIAYSSAAGLVVKGKNNLIENNWIHDICWSGTLDHNAIKIEAPTGENTGNNRVKQNTIYNGGNTLLHFTGPRNIIELNHVYSGGRLCQDVSLIYTLLPLCEYSQVRFNWVHDVYTPHIALGIRGDDKTRRLSVHHNVVWNVGWDGITVKGDENKVYNNTGFNNGYSDILIQTGEEVQKDWHEQYPPVAEQNANTYTQNNLLRELSGSRWNNTPASGTVSNNILSEELADLLNDPEHNDFRPRLGSGLINKGKQLPEPEGDFSIEQPDVGAYEYKDSIYWIPGFRQRTATSPLPANESHPSSEFIDLIWLQAYKAKSHDVYFGSDRFAVENAGHDSPEYMGRVNGNIYHPGALLKDSSYYWRIDANLDEGSIEGATWTFTPTQNANPYEYKISFLIVAKTDTAIIPVDRVEVRANQMIAITDKNGSCTHFTTNKGSQNFEIFRKGFLEKNRSLLIASDTCITDTIVAAENAYTLKLLVKDSADNASLPNAHILLDDAEYFTNSEGIASISELSYGYYNIQVKVDGYFPLQTQGFELYSDSTIVFALQKDYHELGIHLLDLSSGDNIIRAFVFAKDEIIPSDINGIATLEGLETGMLEFRVEHENYFTLEHSVFIRSDTVLNIEMQNRRSSLGFQIEAANIPVENANLSLEGFSKSSDQEGLVYFSNLPARKRYAYTVSHTDFQSIIDSVYLDKDTVLSVKLSPLLNLLSKSNNSIRIYPNPSYGQFALYMPCPVHFRLYNATGTLLQNKLSDSYPTFLDLSNYPSGLYHLIVQYTQEKESYRLVRL